MNFCLSDLVPPLRWSDASTITLLTGQPDLPDAWWRSLPMPRVLATIGPESLGELLTEIALEHWPAASVGDVLPALHVLDPEEADEPAVAIALDRAGSWAGLLALTGRELVDQPFIQARPVLNTLFAAVLVRLSHPPHQEAAAEPVVGAHPRVAAEAEPVRREPEPAPAAEEPVQEAVAAERAAEPADEGEAPEEAAPVLNADAVEETHEPESVPDAAEKAAPKAAAEEAALKAEGLDEPAEADHVDAEQVAEVPEVEGADAEAPEVRGADAEAEPAEAEHAEVGVPEAEHADAGVPEAERAEGEHAEAADAEAQHAEADRGAEAPDAEHAAQQAEDQQVQEEHDEPAEQQEPVAASAGDSASQDHQLTDLIEAAFAGLDDKSWAVAQNRVFTDEPSAVDQLAKLFAVPPAEISATEDELRARLEEWLASDEAAPYRAHLDELGRKLGPAVPKDQLIGAADWHNVEIRALEVPAWQFVLATLQPSPPPQAQPQSAFGPLPGPPPPPPGPPQFQAFTPSEPPAHEANGGSEEPQGYQPLKDVSQTSRCFRQPDGRWWLRIDVTAEQLAGGECALPTGFASYLGLSPGEGRAVRSAAGELTMTWHGRPVLESIERLLVDVGAREGGHLFLTLSDEGVLRARHLPVAAQGAEKITKALRLVGYTAPGGTRDQAARVIATRIGMTGPVNLPDLLNRLRERGDRDLLELLD
ncbi:hypothetical protein ACFOY2_33855 [Nonomuraea purpurea]|uniref:Uncharacterized protein n=1 Tax=Nonomuraea purpurea TaxID=1849276 RepID=A0ABV8GE60_9ACTN